MSSQDDFITRIYGREVVGDDNAVMLEWAKLLSSANKSIDIVDDDAGEFIWVFRLAASLVAAIERGVRITVVCVKRKKFNFDIDAEPEDHDYRIHYLGALGCRVRVYENSAWCPLRVILIDGEIKGAERLFLLSQPSSMTGRRGEVFHGDIPLEIVNHIGLHVKSAPIRYDPPKDYQLKLAKAGIDRAMQYIQEQEGLFGGLYKKRKFKLEWVDRCQIMAQDNPIRGYKIEQTRALAALYVKYGIPFFEAASFKLTNGNDEILQGIVLEPLAKDPGEGYFIAEGHHRIWHMKLNCHDDHIHAYVMTGNPITPPSETRDLEDLEVSELAPVRTGNKWARNIERLSRVYTRWKINFIRC